MTRPPSRSCAAFAALVAVLVCAHAALAQDSGFGGSSSPFAPSTSVPVSQLGHSFAMLDPTRLHVSTSLSFGTGYGGASQGLQVTSLSYQFGMPLAMSVSVGSTFGATSNRNAFFLEGLNVRYHPTSSMMFNVEFHDFRSPLQTSRYSQDPFGWGY